MTYKELYDKALWDLEHNKITLGEFEKMIEPLNEEIPKEEQTDGDLISRKEAEKCCLDGWNKDYKDILEDIRKLPSVENTAEWIFLTSKSAKCSNCGHIQFTNGEDTTKNTLIHKALYHYCPMCGAKMKGGN